MTNWAKPGVKCVCIATLPIVNREYTGAVPQVGETYVIRKTIAAPFPHIGLTIAVEGIESGLYLGGPFWQVEHFRPLITRTQEQDVRAIKSMLRELPAESRLDRLLEALDQ